MKRLVFLTLLASCGGSSQAAFDPCPGEVVLEDQRCGPRFDGCGDAEVATLGGGCAGVGVTSCAAGFTLERASCTPVLPPSPCAPGTMALPGETTCRAVGICSAATGDVYVDGSKTGGDGTKARPFSTIQAAIAAASSGATIAVSKGEYAENLTIAKAVTIVGSCASEVTIRGVDPARAAISARASTTLRKLTITGSFLGVSGTATTVSAEEVRVHDTAAPAFDLSGGSLVVRGSLLESNAYAGVAAFGAKVLVEASVIRDTKFREGKGGPGILGQLDKGVSPEIVVRGSIIERNRETGVGVAGGSVVVEDSLVADTEGMADGTTGIGVLASRDNATRTRASMRIARSVISGNREIGVALTMADGTLESTVVRDTRPRSVDGFYGVGVQVDPASTLVMRDSVLERNRHLGLAVFAGTATVERSIVRDTLLEGANVGAAGVGAADVSGVGSQLTMTSTLVAGSVVAGIMIYGSKAVLEGCTVRDTLASPAGTFGDGIVVSRAMPSLVSTLELHGVLVEKSARAGAAVFGGDLHLAGSRFSCSAFDLDVEDARGVAALFDDGGNACGCGALRHCLASSSALTPIPFPDRAP